MGRATFVHAAGPMPNWSATSLTWATKKLAYLK